MYDAHMSDTAYEGSLSSLTRYGTLNTPSLKSARERKGKARLRHPARDRAVGTASGKAADVKVYNINTPEQYSIRTVDSFRPSSAASQHSTARSDEARAIKQAQEDHKAMLRARVAGNEEAL